MKKVISVILSLIFVISLSGCGSPPSSAADESPTPSAKPSSTQSEALGQITGEITVSAYDTMQAKAFLEEAARLFEEKYPDTKVNIETFSAMPEIKTSEQGGKKMMLVEQKDDSQSRGDYISKINTALMSGSGADILAMDILPAYKYVDGGQLENLTEYINSDSEFNREDYRTNILNAVEYKNGTWFLPLDYTFDYYAYDSTLLTGEAEAQLGIDSSFTLDELIAMAEPVFDGANKLINSVDYAEGRGGSLWNRLLEESYASFVDVESKSANFTDGSFEALLESVKEYSEKGYIPKGSKGQANAEAMLQRSGEVASDRFFFKPKNIFNLLSLFTRDLGIQMTVMAEGGTMAIGEDDEIAGIAASANGSVPFCYSQAYGINSNSQNKETAWTFIKFLLSEEIQLNANMSPTAMPLLNSAREKKAELLLTGARSGGKAPEMSDTQKAALQEAFVGYNQSLERLSAQINDYVFTDTTVNDMIAAEVQYFFDGTKTASEIAEALQSKVELYLNE